MKTASQLIVTLLLLTMPTFAGDITTLNSLKEKYVAGEAKFDRSAGIGVVYGHWTFISVLKLLLLSSDCPRFSLTSFAGSDPTGVDP